MTDPPPDGDGSVTDPSAPATSFDPAAVDHVAVLRSKPYLSALVLAALLGIPISVLAYGFLALTAKLQDAIFRDLPDQLFTGTTPAWWPLPWLVLCGLLTAAVVRGLPGKGGHSPALGFQVGGGPPVDRELPGIILAALATLSLGAVLGPEAPLIAIGGGLAALTVRLVDREAPPMALTIMAAAGSFAAVSTLLGSPLLGAFLIMEAAGIGGTTLSLVALPGLLSSGIGALVFIGLNSWTGLGTFSLALPTVPPAENPTIPTMAWALLLGAAAAPIGWGIRWVALSLRPIVHRSRIPVTAGLGLLVGLIATAYQLISDHSFTQVLFSGEDALPELVADATDYSIATLLLLAVCKAAAYALSLSAFRGGPVFPALMIGGALGIAASELPGMGLASAIAVGIGAMATTMLRLPLTATLLAVVLLGEDGIAVTPAVITAVVAAFVMTGLIPEPTGRQPAASPG
jgi:H+/Cl- antiporter ClcA